MSVDSQWFYYPLFWPIEGKGFIVILEFNFGYISLLLANGFSIVFRFVYPVFFSYIRMGVLVDGFCYGLKGSYWYCYWLIGTGCRLGLILRVVAYVSFVMFCCLAG